MKHSGVFSIRHVGRLSCDSVVELFEMGNTVQLSRAPNDNSDYHDEAYKTFEDLIKEENGESEDEEIEPRRGKMTPFQGDQRAFSREMVRPGNDMGGNSDKEQPEFETFGLGMSQIGLGPKMSVIYGGFANPQIGAVSAMREAPGGFPMPQNSRAFGMEQFLATDEHADIDPSEYDLPFENIVFEGGGNKGLAHCGALRYLEKIGLKGDRIKRVAGASAGSIMAALAAVGHSAADIEKDMRENDMKRMFLDGSWYGIVRNLFWYFGMHEANLIYNWLGVKLAEKTKGLEKKLIGKPEDITFEEVYTHFGKELCIVVTNLNLMTTEYCHPKTTPRMPVRQAVRMSTSLPGLFTAKLYKLHGDADVFVDGGLLCNYPIQCFDGWFLSMKPEDNFTEKMQDVHSLDQLNEDRFGKNNPTNLQTLGISLYAENEEDLLKQALEMKLGKPEPKIPDDTTLSQIWWKKDINRRQTATFCKKREEASVIFLKLLQKCTKDDNNDIRIEDIEKALAEIPFLQERRLHIFGVEPSEIFKRLDTENSGKVNYGKLIGEMGDLGLKIQNRSLGCQRSIIDGFYSFLDTIQSTLLINVKGIHVKYRDAERTVGINTGHVETKSFDLEDGDKDFLIKRGENACRKFLQRFIIDHNIQPR